MQWRRKRWAAAWRGRTPSIAVVVLTLLLPAAAAGAAERSAAAHRSAAGTDAAGTAARAVLALADHQHLPFAIVDKQAARIAVYHRDGRLAGVAPVLLGRMPGDHWQGGVGERAQHGQLRNSDRTTPAGRFASEPGRNRSGEAVVWIDYALALAIHQLRPGPSAADRARRLASASAADKRVSDGCVVVPPAFFTSVVLPLLGASRGVVYVLPETAGGAMPIDDAR